MAPLSVSVPSDRARRDWNSSSVYDIGLLSLHDSRWRRGCLSYATHSPPRLVEATVPRSREACSWSVGLSWKGKLLDIAPLSGKGALYNFSTVIVDSIDLGAGALHSKWFASSSRRNYG